MPVYPVAIDGESPPEPYSPSPPPAEDKTDRREAAGPSKKPKMTAADIQRRQLEKLLENPTKEVQMPQGAKEKTLRAPQEMMKNVQGSSAGAGSGEFHVYKASRRREYERLKIMSDKAEALEEQAAFRARQAERDAAADAKTAKNRAKRQKRKQGGSGAKKNGKDDDGDGDGNGPGAGAGAGAGVKRKLEGGAGTVVFRRPGEEAGDSDEDDQTQGAGLRGEDGPAPGVLGSAAAAVEPPRVLEEPKIAIVDDD